MIGGMIFRKTLNASIEFGKKKNDYRTKSIDEYMRPTISFIEKNNVIRSRCTFQFAQYSAFNANQFSFDATIRGAGFLP